ncbi:general substrate transporter [Aspergillus ambiguus]|uniref:sugar porter family MFS transporter n=1 Tax=Aspergillus ambiguus TaxID=176160 RepID=UPI003CCC9E44
MRDYHHLPQQEEDHSPPPPPSSSSPLALLRISWLTAVVCCGGMLFGYDSGVIGGVLTFDSFLRDFRATPDLQTRVSAVAVGIQQAGALLGSLAIWPVTNRYGRRYAMMSCSAIFCVGVIFEVLNLHSLPIFYLGRVICGLGIGGSATVIPIYLSEMSPTDMRARLGSCFQFTFTIGILVSYWIDYGLQFRPPTPAQWQIPLALQLVPGALMGLGMLTLDESVRWLLAHDDDGDVGATATAWSSLVWIRASDGPAVADEFAQMKRAIDDDRHATAGFHPRELLDAPNARRLLLSVGLFLAQQSTGATAMAYFGPQFFALLVGDNQSLTLLLTGVFGALKVVSCLAFIVWVAERFGRRPLLIGGAFAMAICMIATAVVLKTNPNSPVAAADTAAAPPVSVPDMVTIGLIYLAIVIYNLSWGPLPWPCAAELFSTRIREPGVAVGVAAQWLSNFIWSFSTPYIIAGIGWASFLLFGLLDVAISAFAAVCLPETAGKSLEEIDALFEAAAASHTPDEEEDATAPLTGKTSLSDEREVLGGWSRRSSQ